MVNAKSIPTGPNPVTAFFWRAFFWRADRTTVPYDLWVIAILAFVWLTPPAWLHDPTAPGAGLRTWLGY